jgi:hypothetical protein
LQRLRRCAGAEVKHASEFIRGAAVATLVEQSIFGTDDPEEICTPSPGGLTTRRADGCSPPKSAAQAAAVYSRAYAARRTHAVGKDARQLCLEETAAAFL